MPQLTPVTVNPGDEARAKDFLDTVLAELVRNGAPHFETAGEAIWTGMATVMVIWVGLKTAFSGDYDLWEIVQLVIGLGIPRTILTFYRTPVPGTAMSFPELITAQGNWAMDAFIGDSWKSLQVTLLPTFKAIFTQITNSILSFGIGDVFAKGVSFLVASLFSSVFMALLLVLLLLMFCLLMAQVIWAQIALAITILVGPILIPWLVFPPMSFLFWGWFRTLLTYTLYGVIAGAIFNVFLNVGLGFVNRLFTAVLTFEDLWSVFWWFLILLPLIVAGLLASLKVGELAQLLLSGAGSTSAGLGTRVRQAALAAKTGGASLAAGAAK